MRKMIYFILFSMLLGIVFTRSDWVSPPSGGGVSDGNNYPNSLTISGSSLKTVTIGREGMSDLTADFSDMTGGEGSGNSTEQMVEAINKTQGMYNISVNCSNIIFNGGTKGSTSICDGADATGSGSGAPTDAPYLIGETMNRGDLSNEIVIPEDAVFWEEFNYPAASYNRITTAPTANVAELGKPSCMNFATSAVSGIDGGYIASGGTATNLALFNVSQLRYMKTGFKLAATAGRSDIIGMFKSANTIVQNSSLTGIFFYYNVTTSANWFAIMANAGALTQINSGIATDTNWHNFTINSSGTEFQMWIDNTLVTTFNKTDSTYPITLVSSLGTWVENRQTTADTQVLNYFYYRMKRGY